MVMMMMLLLVVLMQVLTLGVSAYGLTPLVVRRLTDGCLGRGTFHLMLFAGRDHLVKVLDRHRYGHGRQRGALADVLDLRRGGGGTRVRGHWQICIRFAYSH